ncbi:hypothetical protein IVA98_18850 [Bradyrhizobium sp. 160]|uniref:hypothetical protein n=1 Tax=unclassified Bradyrhizobium TaxID=2631580 RepID=UPI001FF797B3|nr:MULTISPECIES: hypothetical protein [unclassified Bradyrhizobium]MCK1545998.1 hypothetical protein [Bradyrhizobium sp. 179]MCK1625192.1 hypothetical protein [Bradyrhizobium sp. 160]
MALRKPRSSADALPRAFDNWPDVEARAFEAAMPSETLTASRDVGFTIGDHASLRLFCPTSQMAWLERFGLKFINDLYCAWGCFRVFCFAPSTHGISGQVSAWIR